MRKQMRPTRKVWEPPMDQFGSRQLDHFILLTGIFDLTWDASNHQAARKAWNATTRSARKAWKAAGRSQLLSTKSLSQTANMRPEW